MNVTGLQTPALVLDRRRLAANLARMRDKAAALGVALRPHLKTAKSADIAHLATAGQPGGITVSTLKEAAYFIAQGFTDITYAVGIAVGKLDPVAALQRDGARIAILTDNADVARGIAARAAATGARFDVLIEIDTGDHRAGVAPESPALLEIAECLAVAPNVAIRGVLTHAGHSYNCRTTAEIVAVAEEERAGAVLAAERLRAAGRECPVVSVGSTPTAIHARDLSGVTEMRPGVYMFNDVFQASIGACAMADIALSVLATVTGHHPERGEILIDAGGLALSKDRSTAAGPRDVGYGLAVGLDEAELPEMHVVRVSQEHGVVAAAPGAGVLPFAALPPGARLRVLPNHACMTAAAYDCYHVVEGDEVVATWPRINGW
ncbi:MAG TPA: alanine racemase [Kiloniellales bacterium]